MEEDKYEKLLNKQEEEHEDLCIRCGACCGAYDGDPCRFLLQHEDHTYSCSVYENRLGWQKTVSGEEFKCVPIREIVHLDWPGAWNCPYKKDVKQSNR